MSYDVFSLTETQKLGIENALKMKPNDNENSSKLQCNIALPPILGFLLPNTNSMSTLNQFKQNALSRGHWGGFECQSRDQQRHVLHHCQEVKQEEEKKEEEEGEEVHNNDSVQMEKRQVGFVKNLVSNLTKDQKRFVLELQKHHNRRCLKELYSSNTKTRLEATESASLGKFCAFVGTPKRTSSGHFKGRAYIAPVRDTSNVTECPVFVEVDAIVPNQLGSRLFLEGAQDILDAYCESSRSLQEVQQASKALDDTHLLHLMIDRAVQNPNNPCYVHKLMMYLMSAMRFKNILPNGLHVYSMFKAEHHQYFPESVRRLLQSNSNEKAHVMPVVVSILQDTECSLREAWIQLMEHQQFHSSTVMAHIFQLVFALSVLQSVFGLVLNMDDYLSIRMKQTRVDDSPYLYYRWNNQLYRVPTYGFVMKLHNFHNASFVWRGSRFVADGQRNRALDYKLPYQLDLSKFAKQVLQFFVDVEDQPQNYNGYTPNVDPGYAHMLQMLRSWVASASNQASPAVPQSVLEQQVQMVHRMFLPLSMESIRPLLNAPSALPSVQQDHFKQFQVTKADPTAVVFEHVDFIPEPHKDKDEFYTKRLLQEYVY